MPLTDLPKMVPIDGQDYGLGDKPGASELGPEQEFPVVQPPWVHKAETIERPHECEHV